MAERLASLGSHTLAFIPTPPHSSNALNSVRTRITWFFRTNQGKYSSKYILAYLAIRSLRSRTNFIEAIVMAFRKYSDGETTWKPSYLILIFCATALTQPCLGMEAVQTWNVLEYLNITGYINKALRHLMTTIG